MSHILGNFIKKIHFLSRIYSLLYLAINSPLIFFDVFFASYLKKNKNPKIILALSIYKKVMKYIYTLQKAITSKKEGV